MKTITTKTNGFEKFCKDAVKNDWLSGDNIEKFFYEDFINLVSEWYNFDQDFNLLEEIPLDTPKGEVLVDAREYFEEV